MKQKAMDVKLVVRPLIGCLTHTHFWEGPCRAGHKEDMTVEAETKAADETFKESVEALKGVIDEVQFTEPMDVMRLIASCAWDGEFQNWNATTNR